jgi:hypothetical protein
VQWKHSQAVRIGWFDGETIYLDEHETTNLVQTLATQRHNQISQPTTVKNRLVEKGWLQCEHRGRQDPVHGKIPLPLEGARRRCWRLAPVHFWPPDTADPPPPPPLAPPNSQPGPTRPPGVGRHFVASKGYKMPIRPTRPSHGNRLRVPVVKTA